MADTKMEGHRKEGTHEKRAQRMRKQTERHPLLSPPERRLSFSIASAPSDCSLIVLESELPDDSEATATDCEYPNWHITHQVTDVWTEGLRRALTVCCRWQCMMWRPTLRPRTMLFTVQKNLEPPPVQMQSNSSL